MYVLSATRSWIVNSTSFVRRLPSQSQLLSSATLHTGVVRFELSVARLKPYLVISAGPAEGRPCLKVVEDQMPLGAGVEQSTAFTHCIAKIAATSRTGSTVTGPVAVTSARTMVPLKTKGAE